MASEDRKSQRCSHEATVSVRMSGLERVVCERCGHVTVRYLSALSGSVDRSRFAREADRTRRHLAEAQDPDLEDDLPERDPQWDFRVETRNA